MNAKAIVVGAGVSGKAAAAALLRRGFDVTLAVRGPDSSLDGLFRDGARIASGPQAESVSAFARANPSAEAVFSPGLPLDAPEYAAARAGGLRVRGELSLGCELFGGRVIAVTGSKGKSSLVKFIADALTRHGAFAVPCGNYGTPVCAVADMNPRPEFAVVECSSFQLEGEHGALRPEAAVFLNLSVDHLTRHGTMEAYRDAKLGVFGNLRPGGLALLPENDGPWNIGARAAQLHPGLAFSRFRADDARGVASGYFDNAILMPAAAAAVRTLRHFGLTDSEIAGAFRAFEPLPHRMTRVCERGGVTWIDNSKATSFEALLASVKMSPRPVFLIAGGRAKEPVPDMGAELASLGVAKCYAIGECSDELVARWGLRLGVEACGTLAVAASAAARDASAAGKGCVLLAPGTASFDQFRSFEERGDAFVALAMRICARADRT